MDTTEEQNTGLGQQEQDAPEATQQDAPEAGQHEEAPEAGTQDAPGSEQQDAPGIEQYEDEVEIEFAGLEGSVGLGVDLVEIARMKRVLDRTPRFAVRVYTDEERSYCESTAQPYVHYATRFAAKEAVLKALGTGFAFGIAPADVEVVRNQYGRPQVRLHRRAADAARELGVREIPVSLSYTHSDAVACAMAITDDSVRVAEERIDPMEELAKQFKEARSLLDDLPVRNEHGETVGNLPELGVTPDSADAADASGVENDEGFALSDGADAADADGAADANDVSDADAADAAAGQDASIEAGEE